ncbi:MAG: hypothetical protein SPF91_04290 [Clostridium sp.]|nr:hypothetical protein [Clostridium sp.]
MELASAQAGDTVVVLDIGQTRENNQIFHPIREEYERMTNRISVQKDGLALRFLETCRDRDGDEESLINIVNGTVATLSALFRLGARQQAALRLAILFAVENREKYESELQAVGEGLLQQESSSALAVHERLWTLLNLDVMGKGKKKLLPGKLNIVSFTGLDEITRRLLCELLLLVLWRKVQMFGQQQKRDVIISLDEFQALSLREGSALRGILREGRKFNVSLYLATQTVTTFPVEVISLLHQSGTHLYFAPPVNEVPKTAKEIDPTNYKQWQKKLKNLSVGESVSLGSFMLGDNLINRPLILQ